jgi:hypothetical protein
MLSIAKCGHCGKSGTKVAEIEPSGASYKQIAICCSWCSAVLGVTGYYDTGTLLKKAEKEQLELSKRISQMERQIHAILNALR